MQQVDVGPHYNFQSGSQAWHLTADAAGLIFIGITAHAPALLEELKRTFSAKCGEKVAASRESELTAACKSLFKKLCAKYDDLASIDQLNKTMAKVEGVKMIMQENIEIALQNCALIAVIVPLALKYGGSDDDDDKK
ncbi:SNAP receptor [Aureococcus anophagefferens]|nr:SNAP receptor [Aureococcus anophagefferens]